MSGELDDPPNIRDLIARTLADHAGGEGTWDRLTAAIDPRMDLTSQERARRAQGYRDAAEAVRVAMFKVPCGSCHPCENWVGEEWRRAGRKPPYPDEWNEKRTRLIDVEKIARAAVVLCADFLSRFHFAGSKDMSVVWLSRNLRDEWGRQVLAWQDQLDQNGSQP